MSLNGLDHPAIVEAYQSALADAGGWLLLHYTSRDEVALLNRGTGGVPEVRNAIETYGEPSPLYGFLQYRRRKVILRYTPEGTSRLIQARSNVQFQSITEKFTPNDTVLSLTHASDLNESALSSACLLHTASGSITSSSSSLRRRRLREITEDAEENGTREETREPLPPSRLEPRQRSGSQMSEATIVAPTVTSEAERPSPDLRPPPSRASSRAPSFRSESRTSNMTSRSPDSSTERSRYRNILDEFPRPSDDVRMSTQSARPSLRELERAAGIQPKIKLGPRPSVDQSGRPLTSGSSQSADQRPVAALPAGMRPAPLRRPNANVEVPRPRSQGSSFASRPNSRAPPIPPLLVPPPSIPISRPQLSPGAKSLGALSTSSGLTPEKERLMKALQQRKKQMAKRAEQVNKKQSLAELRKAEEKIPQSQEENKENICLVPGPKKPAPAERKQQAEVEKSPNLLVPTSQSAQNEPQAESLPEPAPAPAPKRVPIAQPELESQTQPLHRPEPAPVPIDTREPEPTSQFEHTSQPKSDQPNGVQLPPAPTESETIAAASVPNLAKETSSETPASHAEDSITNIILETITESAPVEASNPITAGETHVEMVEPAKLDQDETKQTPVPSSASRDVSLEMEQNDEPGPAIVADVAPISHQPEAAEVVSAPAETENVDIVSADPVAVDVSKSVRLPVTPPADLPPSPQLVAQAEAAVAPVSVSIEPAPLEKKAPEVSPVESTDLPSLDQRRRIYLEPIQVPTPEYSDDDNLLSDDSFMEELRSATVQEARPVTVKTPNSGDSWDRSRAVSSPHHRSPSAQTTVAHRSASSTYPDNGPPTPVIMAKKINVSSGISSRIKALEKFSSREGTPSSGSQTVTGPSASSSFENLRKRASVSLSRPPSFIQTDPPSGINVARRTNSVSVTARIVRDTGMNPVSNGLDFPDSDLLSLQASPLTVAQGPTEQLVGDGEIGEPVDAPELRSMSVSSTGSGRQNAPASRPGSRVSISSRSRTDETLRSASPNGEKKESRASRLMRRMSSMTTSSRRSIVGALSSSVKEEPSTTSVDSLINPPSSTHPPPAEPIDIGEVNVQFPETLLWKRRYMRVDENGYVVLTPATNDTSARNMTKRYHLTEFRTPCLPDEDMQELPNSILLDFLDGSTLQCACESRQGQSSALQTLVDAHNAHQQ